MPRQLRIDYPGAIHHVMSRGDRRENIYHDEVDRQDFLKTLAEACQKTDWRVHAYCLMSNHFHVGVEFFMAKQLLDEPDVSAVFQHVGRAGVPQDVATAPALQPGLGQPRRHPARDHIGV